MFSPLVPLVGCSLWLAQTKWHAKKDKWWISFLLFENNNNFDECFLVWTHEVSKVFLAVEAWMVEMRRDVNLNTM